MNDFWKRYSEIKNMMMPPMPQMIFEDIVLWSSYYEQINNHVAKKNHVWFMKKKHNSSVNDQGENKL